MRPRSRLLTCAAAGLALSSGAAGAVELLGRAVLPSATVSPGPTAGQFSGTNANGVAVPFANAQPVQGFSAVLPGPATGTYLTLSDNGFGAQGNSADALLRLYAVRPDFTTGAVTPECECGGRGHRRISIGESLDKHRLHGCVAGANQRFDGRYRSAGPCSDDLGAGLPRRIVVE